MKGIVNEFIRNADSFGGFLRNGGRIVKLKFNVTGMTCAACSARVEKVTNAVPGVEKAEVNLLAGTMQV